MYEEIKAREDAYLTEANEVISKAKVGAGILGFGSAPKDDPCHIKYYEDVEKLIAEGLDAIDEREAEAVVEFLLFSEKRNPEQDLSIRYILMAVQGLTLPLIPKLSPEKAGEFHETYAGLYKRFQRMPKQSEVEKSLKQQMRG